MTPVSVLRDITRIRLLRWACCFAFCAGSAVGVEGAAPVVGAVPATVAAESPSLHAEIDRLLAADTLVPPMPPADDGEFLRRATLDLWGIIPTAAEARAFLDDRSPDKRTKLIDRLLASPRFARHLATTFDVLWLERKTDKNIPFAGWYDFLYQSFLNDKPYDQLVREILAADETIRPATKFYQVRNGEPDMLTRDIGRLFFGMDMQCNQCHDHPLVDDYKIGDYYGLRAFVSRTYLFTDKDKKVVIGEKAAGEASYSDVFSGESADRVSPRLPRGPQLAAEPVYKKGEELTNKPAKGELPVPKFSRRALLAESAVSAAYDLLPRNAVNRLWAMAFGRGLVHPVDLIHPDNPPSHPAVLDLLTQDFREHGYDVKRTLRELMLTAAYGRTCELPARTQLDAAQVQRRLATCERELAAARQRLADAENAAAGPRKEFGRLEVYRKKSPKSVPDSMLAKAAAEREKYVDAIRPCQTLVNAWEKSLDEARRADEVLRLSSGDARRADQAWQALVSFWNDRGDVPLLRPLPPETFTDSIMQAAGMVATAEAKARAAIKKSPPKEMKEATAETRGTIEAILVDKQTFEPLRTNFSRFIELYAEAPGQAFSATLNQALFFGNSGIVDGWLKPEGTNLTARLAALSDPQELADEMYLAILTRRPTADERRNVAAYLQGAKQARAVAIQEMAWALLSSSEFRFNH